MTARNFSIGRTVHVGTEAPFIDRRRFITSAISTAFCAAAGVTAQPLIARAAASNTFTLGEFEISILSDGHLVTPAPYLALNADRKQLNAAIASAGQGGERVEPPCNVTMIRTKSDVILVDTGAGPHFMPSAGKLIAIPSRCTSALTCGSPSARRARTRVTRVFGCCRALCLPVPSESVVTRSISASSIGPTRRSGHPGWE